MRSLTSFVRWMMRLLIRLTADMRPRRILPPGTLRRLRLKWFALGLLLGTASCAALAMYLAAIMPPELAYRSAATTQHPKAAPVEPAGPLPEVPPCTGQGKDCTDSEATPHLQPVRTVPEPTALALVGIGMAALAAHRTNRSPT